MSRRSAALRFLAAALGAPLLGATALVAPAGGQEPAGLEGAARAAPRTAAAVRVVETYDPATGDRSYATADPLGPGEIAAIQVALGRAGVPVSPTGRLDPPTAAALEHFQTERGLEPCGCASYETLVALGLPTRTTQILVRTTAGDGGRRPGPAEGETGRVEIVYGTPPRRGDAEAGGAGGAADAARSTPAGGAPHLAESRRQMTQPGAPASGFDRGFVHGHLLPLPFFLTPGPLFPPPPITDGGSGTTRRGLPFGRPAGAQTRRGISVVPPPSPAPRPPRRTP